MNDYEKAQLDSLQAQINAQRVKIEQLERRFQRIDNKLTIHLNNKQNNKEVYAE